MTIIDQIVFIRQLLSSLMSELLCSMSDGREVI